MLTENNLSLLLSVFTALVLRTSNLRMRHTVVSLFISHSVFYSVAAELLCFSRARMDLYATVCRNDTLNFRMRCIPSDLVSGAIAIPK